MITGTGNSGAGQTKMMNQYNEDAFENFNTKALEACHNCGRTFLPDSLKIHLRSCDKKYVKLATADGGGTAGGEQLNESINRKQALPQRRPVKNPIDPGKEERQQLLNKKI